MKKALCGKFISAREILKLGKFFVSFKKEPMTGKLMIRRRLAEMRAMLSYQQTFKTLSIWKIDWARERRSITAPITATFLPAAESKTFFKKTSLKTSHDHSSGVIVKAIRPERKINLHMRQSWSYVWVDFELIQLHCYCSSRSRSPFPL